MLLKRLVITLFLVLILIPEASATGQPVIITISKVTKIEYKASKTGKFFSLSGYTNKNVIHNIAGNLSTGSNANCVELASKLNLSSLSSPAKLQIIFGGSSLGGGGSVGGPLYLDFANVSIGSCALIIN